MRATDFGWRQVGGGALFMPSLLLLEAIVLAIFAHDVGGLVFIIAVMVPASIILLARGPRWPGVSLAASLIGMMLLGSVFVFGFPKLKLGGATAHRLLVYRNGIASQEYVWNRAAVEPVPGSFWKSPLERVLGRQIRPRSRAGEAILIRNTEQHLWAMSAWAYAGGWSGGGFGKSPTRRVQVPQDILQADSAYSFYVANEHGALGGAALLLLYALPMGFIFLFRADDELRFGGAFAAVLMGALFLDASAHVLMNLGWIPFTGRDLPLLSVNSGSDFMRFALLLALVAVSVQTDFGEGTWYLPGPGSRRFWRALEVVIFVSVLAVASSPFFDLVWTKTIRDKDGDYLVHDFGPGLQRLQEQFEDPNPDRWPLKLDPDSNRLVARDKRPETFLSQEIARFDEMSEGDRESGGRGAPESRDFWNDLARIKNRWSLECSETNCDGYLGILRYMRARYDNANEQPIDPPLFVVKPPDRYADVNHRVPGDEPEPRIEVNPAFNSVTSARVTSDPSELLHVSLKGARAGVWHVDGDHFHITVPDLEFHPDKTKPRGGITEVRVSLDDSSVTTKDLNESAFYLGFTCPRLPAKNQPGRAATFRVGDGSLWIEPGNIIWDIHLANSRPLRPARSNAPVRLKRGDWADTPSSFCGSKHWLTIGHTDFGSLIGPAWVMGEYATAYQPDSGIPWLSELRTALEIEHLHHNQGTKLPSVLSIDPRLQELASNFISKQGVELHEKLISEVCVDVRTKTGNNDCHVPAKKAFRRLVEDKLPPRVGIVVMRLSCSEKDCNSNGEIIASAGWPHASEQDGWVSSSDDVLPSARWIDLRAPDLVARRYEADRNFERIVVGSASKPIWATAVLRTNPRLRDLWVKGGDERKFERSVFGIDVSEGRRGYELRPCSENLWCGFNCYLACSDNRYQVTLNFLGLANTGDDHGIQVDRELPAWKHESFDEGRTNWSKLPDFGNIGFSSISLSTLLLDQQPLAKALRDRFRIYVTRQQHPEYRFSFWTGNAEDDPTPDYESPSRKDPLGTAFRFITPVATNLELNRIVRPRDLISVLLGGETNLWSNVELIGAFSSAVTGRAVLPHIVVTKDLSVPRQDDNKVAQRLQNALKEVLDPKPIGRRGHTYMGTGHDLKDLWEFAKKNHLQLFAKTGTLDTRVGAANIETEHQMSRFLLILAAKSSPHLERGLAISVFIERVAKDGEAARHWAQKFIIDNQVALLPYLR
jgi:cell division protein FtsW (lipid II flippase)